MRRNPFTFEQTEEIRQRWIALLRDEDKVTKTEGKLCSKGAAHCALGVLWLVAGGDFKPHPAAVDQDIDEWVPIGLEHLGFTNAESEDAYELAGYILEGAADVDEVWRKNDGDSNLGVTKSTFTEIADWLEERFNQEHSNV